VHNSKLFSLLKSFNEDDFKSFRNFVNSPFYNSGKNLIRLYEVIYKYRTDLDNKNLNKEVVFKKLDSKSKTYNHQMMKNYMSELFDLALQYISTKAVQNSNEEKILTIEYLHNVKNFDLAGKLINAELKIYETETDINEKYYINKLRILDLYHNQLIYTGNRELASKVLINIFETLLKYQTLTLFKCRFDLETIRKKKELKEIHPLEISLDKFMDYGSFLDSNPSLEKFNIFYYAFLARINNEDEELYKKLKELIYKYIDEFSMEEKHNMGTFLLNFIYGGLYKKGKKYNVESFELNKFLLEKNIFTLGDTIEFGEQTFYNIANNALIVKEYDWLKKFIEENYKKLNSEFSLNLYNYFYAFINLYQKNYDKALTHLAKVGYTDDFSKLDIRVINMMIYYEMQDYDMALRSVESFRHFISKKDLIVNPVYEEYFHKFIKFYSKLLNDKAANREVDYAVYAEAKKSGPLMYREWLLEKLEKEIK